jgi:hypothetical protein
MTEYKGFYIGNLLLGSTALFIVAVSLACSGTGSGDSSILAGFNATEVAGSWTLTLTENSGTGRTTFNIVLVGFSCDTGLLYPNASGGYGVIVATGSTCYVADSDGGQGSISGTGDLIFPPQRALVGLRSPPNSPSELNLVIIEAADGASENFQYAVFNGQGTISNKEMTGTWSCSLLFPACSGIGGTLSARKQ